MGKLQVLPLNIANLIAAGEVVQRPASVVKELMENAVDAGAGSINVLVSDSGRTLIQVIDDGCGMSPSDAVLCFERHATSKIATAQDLEHILSFGFRGEALASIAAVAEVVLKTRRAKDETATQVRIDGYNNVTTSAVSAPVGSNFCVRNLFYNTPARRKFLKSDSVELKHIIEEFTRVAITRPDIAFSLTSNGKDIFRLGKAKSLKYRILELLGSGLAEDVVDIDIQTPLIHISGFLGRPQSSKKTLGNQFFFVNGRFFRSAYLHKAVMNAYQELIPEGVTPSYFIFIELDPQSVDVNIHPTKTEIKFEDDSLVFQTVYACVKEVLGKNSFGASIDFDTEGAVEFPQLGKSFQEYRGEAQVPQPAADPYYNPFDPQTPLTPLQSDYSFSEHVNHNQNYGALFENRDLISERKALVISGKYIISSCASGMMIVNIKRARERILYEQALDALSKNAHVTQTALFPVQVQVGAANRLVFEDNQELLSKLGFDISSLGTDTVVVNGVPEGYSCESSKVSQLLQDILLILSEDRSQLPELLSASLAAKFAKLGALSGEELSSTLEAQRLLDALFMCSNSELTAGGKKIVNIVSTQEIDNKFQ